MQINCSTARGQKKKKKMAPVCGYVGIILAAGPIFLTLFMDLMEFQHNKGKFSDKLCFIRSVQGRFQDQTVFSSGKEHFWRHVRLIGSSRVGRRLYGGRSWSLLLLLLLLCAGTEPNPGPSLIQSPEISPGWEPFRSVEFISPPQL